MDAEDQKTDTAGGAAGSPREATLDKARRVPADAAKKVAEVLKGPRDGSRSASGPGAAGYVANVQEDEAVADLDQTGPADS